MAKRKRAMRIIPTEKKLEDELLYLPGL